MDITVRYVSTIDVGRQGVKEKGWVSFSSPGAELLIVLSDEQMKDLAVKIKEAGEMSGT